MKAVFAYVPVVHRGTLAFLEKYKDLPILLLDNAEGKKENPYLERDIRALDAAQICVQLHAHGFSSAEVVAPLSIREKTAAYEALIVPHDEITEAFLATYAPTVPLEKVDVFLRWTKQISTAENLIAQDRVITTGEFENSVLNDLEEEAHTSPDWWRQIAAAIVKDGKVVSTAVNTHFPSQHALTINGDPRSNLDAGQGPLVYTSIHAEACVLAHAAKEGIATDKADIFVTTFPCPTCARSLVEAGITRVFYKKGYSLLDAEEILKGAGIEIVLVQDDN